MTTRKRDAAPALETSALDSSLLRRAGLADPLITLLRQDDRAAVRARIWANVSRRLKTPAGVVERVRARFGVGWGVCLAAAMSVGVGVMLWSTPEPNRATHAVAPEARVDAPAIKHPTDVALLLEGGKPFVELELANDAADVSRRKLSFEDGSSIAAKPGTRLEALAMTARDVTLRLVRGSIDVHVVEGGPRRWTIETGVLSVEVVGTEFSVERLHDRVGVRVQHGAVLVRSGELAERVERLGAGQELSLAVAAEPPIDMSREVNDPQRSVPTLSVEDLLQRADGARIAGELDRARRDLETIVRQFSKDPRAGLAAYQLASVMEQQGVASAEVIRAFERALVRASGASLRQDCYWRLSQAQLRAGQASESRKTAEAALAEYPAGRYAERLRQHIESLRK